MLTTMKTVALSRPLRGEDDCGREWGLRARSAQKRRRAMQATETAAAGSEEGRKKGRE
jgi:hypothetical protein